MKPFYHFESGLYYDSGTSFFRLGVLISESECVIAVSNKSSVVVYMDVYKRPEAQYHDEFLREVFKQHQSLFSQNYHSIAIGVETIYFALVPDELNLEGNEVISFLSGTGNRKVLADDLNKLEATMVYSIPNLLFDVIKESFQDFDIQLCTTNGVKLTDELSQYDGFVCLDRKQFDIIIKKNNQLHSVSRHHYDFYNDVIYYTLLGLKDANIDPSKAKMAFSGYIDKSSDLAQELMNFIGTVDIKLFEDSISIPPDFDQPKQYYQYALNLLHANN